MQHPDHTQARLAQGYRASGLGPEEASAAAQADLTIRDTFPEPGEITPTESRALSAQEYATWALERAGFRDAIANGRDSWDGMVLTSPGGGQVQITPVDPIA